MFRTGLIFAICFGSSALAQNNQVTITSAASASAGLAPESLATVRGSNLTTDTISVPRPPWPTTAGGVTLQITDSASVTRAAGLLLVISVFFGGWRVSLIVLPLAAVIWLFLPRILV